MNLRLCSLLAAGGLLLLCACTRQETAREIDWAKAALARNPAFEIIATDESTGIFTVRNIATGRFETVKLQDLVAAPLPPKTVAQPAAAPPPAAEAVESPAVADAAAGTLASGQTTDAVEPGAESAGHTIAQGPGYSIQRGEDAPPQAASTLEGPGYSITRQEPAEREETPRPDVVDTSIERRTDPIICQGDRLMRIDGETIEFSGDAVIAENGCDLYISNARIRAGGVGIIARQARVHIVNSSIGGSRGSYEASEGAEIYVAHTTFTGIGRRFDSATMNDLGGNAYQTE
ncbi:MAG TPA: hypothetical protein VFU13_05970 [Steroidobacteraceae bacterium]|nr:hypothetical protein [Steroidobacteraceae bacterium]